MAKPAQLYVFKNKTAEKVLKSKVARAKKAIRGIEQEIGKLLTQSKNGTVPKKPLKAGLVKITMHCRRIDDHWP